MAEVAEEQQTAAGLDGLVKAVENQRLAERGLAPEPVKTDPPVETKVVDPPKVDPQKTDPPPAEKQYWESIGEELGTPFKSKDELVNELKSGRDVSKQFNEAKNKLKDYDSLDPLARDIDRVIKSGQDVSLYLEARNVDVQKLEPKDVLKKAYMLQNQELIKAGKKDIAERQFERDYRNKYSALEPKDLSVLSDEEKLAHEQARLDAQDALEIATIVARKEVTKWKADHTTVVEPKPEEQAQQLQHYLTEVEQAVNGLNSIDIQVGDKTFKYGVTDIREEVKGFMSDPLKFLKLVGLDPNNIDIPKFRDTVVTVLTNKKVGKPLTDWWLEQNNAQTLKSQLNDPPPVKPIAPGADPKKDGLDRMAESIKAQQEAERQSAR